MVSSLAASRESTANRWRAEICTRFGYKQIERVMPDALKDVTTDHRCRPCGRYRLPCMKCGFYCTVCRILPPFRPGFMRGFFFIFDSFLLFLLLLLAWDHDAGDTDLGNESYGRSYIPVFICNTMEIA